MCPPSRTRSHEICKPGCQRKTIDPKSGIGTVQPDYFKAFGSGGRGHDRMTSFLKAYGNAEALKVAKDLDEKVEALLASAAG